MSGEEDRHEWLRRLRRMFTCALLAGDELSAETAVGEAVAAGLTSAEIDALMQRAALN
jgi:hypothetical protein